MLTIITSQANLKASNSAQSALLAFSGVGDLDARKLMQLEHFTWSRAEINYCAFTVKTQPMIKLMETQNSFIVTYFCKVRRNTTHTVFIDGKNKNLYSDIFGCHYFGDSNGTRRIVGNNVKFKSTYKVYQAVIFVA